MNFGFRFITLSRERVGNAMQHFLVNVLLMSDIRLSKSRVIHTITLEEAEHVTARGGGSITARAPPSSA